MLHGAWYISVDWYAWTPVKKLQFIDGLWYKVYLFIFHFKPCRKKFDLKRSPKMGQISLVHNVMYKIAFINWIIFYFMWPYWIKKPKVEIPFTGPVGSLICADLCGSIKITITVLNPICRSIMIFVDQCGSQQSHLGDNTCFTL